MKKLNLLLLCTMLFTSALFAQTSDDQYKKKFDALLTEAYSKDAFSGNILVAKNGDIFYQSSVGNADYEKNIPNDAETKFQIGSITKLFTRIIMLQLAAENQISLNDHIGKYLQGFIPAIAENVTIQQLMDHTSGLEDYTNEPGFMETSERIKTINDILPLIQKESLQFAPGSKVEYSNSGYVVLAAIIEKVTGTNYGEALNKRIFEKTGMLHSGFGAFVKDEQGKARGYLSNQLGSKQDNLSWHIVGGGDGGIYASAGDMWKFAKSIISDNKLLSQDGKLQLVNTPLFPVHYTSWDEFLQKGKFAVAGGAPGISAVLAINMEKQYCFVALSNYDEGTAEDMAQRITAVLNDKTPVPFQFPPARTIYDIIKNKGAKNFIDHYKAELDSAGIILDNDMILLFVGEQFLQEKSADNAIALYTVYTKEFPNIVVAWNDMGDAYLMKGEKENAKKCFEHALQIRPGNQRAKQSLQKLN